MTCPDWSALAMRRDAEPAAWGRALEHFDECPRCREQALTAEPTLLFRALPAPAAGRDEVAAMKRGVAAMRRAAAVQHGPRPRDAARPAPWLRSAALAAVLLIAALLQGAIDVEQLGGAPPAEPVAAAVAPAAAPSALALEQMPLVEYLDATSGPMIQVVDDEISLVLVLPAGLDV